ncbi:MAG: hypothetical protein A2103_04605 [Gammaproteobacteria bacterium GWF2_41_13]|nr:MAG: hypothetical protein A2103_04605 [Gammaproteobacteria bacterium GWF2_41_13]
MTIPLSCYIHIPWCIRKCPYCDFNSYAITSCLPEQQYLEALKQDLTIDAPLVQNGNLISIFIGGGTPSVFSAKTIAQLLDHIHQQFSFDPHIEITLESNPGTLDKKKLRGLRSAGINRLSIGIQSFQDNSLRQLNRIHSAKIGQQAIKDALWAGYQNINIDLMYGLPHQTLDMALRDLTLATEYPLTHLSWYQLTLEPNTLFATHPPILPNDEIIFDIQEAGYALLKKAHYQQYGISAFCQTGYSCLHNMNYWQFGDYLGIGAGAHSKLTKQTNIPLANETSGIDTNRPEYFGFSARQRGESNRHASTIHDCCEQRRQQSRKPKDEGYNRTRIIRSHKLDRPEDYLQGLQTHSFIADTRTLTDQEIPLEFMMNVLRLKQGVPLNYFQKRTGLPFSMIQEALKKAQTEKFIRQNTKRLCPTKHGQLFLNDCLQIFMP